MSNLDRDNNTFLRIVDAMELIDRKVNLIGVVTEFGIPKRSRGTDVYCTLRIVDKSHPTSGICIIVFTEAFEQLPQVQSAGDIVQLSRITVRLHESKVNAVFYKDNSSFALYKGNDGSTFVPYQVSSKFHGREQDKKLLLDLRKWAISHLQPEPVSTTDSLLLRQMSEGSGFNLICKVVHLCEAREGEWMLFVWDGTDAPAVNVRARPAQAVPLQLEATPLSRDVLCTFPTVGTVLRMTADPFSEKQMCLHTLKAVGRWVHFKNIKFEVRCGFWCGILLPVSKFSYLSDDNHLVLKYQRRYEKRFRGQWSRMPWSAFPAGPSHVTETKHQHVPFVTLMDILSHQEVLAKFRCVVRVVATLPGHPSGFQAPCGCYRLRLTLEDPTVRIHAYLLNEDAETFFGGYPSKDKMIKMHNMLLGVEEANGDTNGKPRSPPWVDCCLKSYYTDETDLLGSRIYCIFDTKLIG